MRHRKGKARKEIVSFGERISRPEVPEGVSYEKRKENIDNDTTKMHKGKEISTGKKKAMKRGSKKGSNIKA